MFKPTRYTHPAGDGITRTPVPMGEGPSEGPRKQHHAPAPDPRSAQPRKTTHATVAARCTTPRTPQAGTAPIESQLSSNVGRSAATCRRYRTTPRRRQCGASAIDAVDGRRNSAVVLLTVLTPGSTPLDPLEPPRDRPDERPCASRTRTSCSGQRCGSWSGLSAPRRPVPPRRAGIRALFWGHQRSWLRGAPRRPGPPNPHLGMSSSARSREPTASQAPAWESPARPWRPRRPAGACLRVFTSEGVALFPVWQFRRQPGHRWSRRGVGPVPRGCRGRLGPSPGGCATEDPELEGGPPWISSGLARGDVVRLVARPGGGRN